MTALRSGSATDVGRRRHVNQDMILEGGTIFAVADGMGGHQGGEVASLAAIKAIRDAFARNPSAEGVADAVAEANLAVAKESKASAELRNMGTTLTIIALVPGDDANNSEDDLLVIAHIGDSRAYLFRDNELTQLTDDHSLPQELLRQGQLTEAEAAVDRRRNIITRALGQAYGEGPDLQNLIPYTGDRLLVCSDGLYNEVGDGDVAKVLRTIADPTEAAQHLVDMANAHGGGDNISVVIVDVVDDDGRAEAASESLAAEDDATVTSHGLMTADQRNAQLRDIGRGAKGSWENDTSPPDEHQLPSRRLTPRVAIFVVLLLIVVGGAGAAIGVYARGAYYVGLDHGQVAIFKGRPGGLLWFQPTVEERT
ncbi:MAG: family protein phosphatase, partial [Actinomycetota bacterium]|nr:family protein phosphatase [Actinomycetota bacterium]